MKKHPFAAPSAEVAFDLPQTMAADMQAFVDALAGQDGFALMQFGGAMTREVVLRGACDL